MNESLRWMNESLRWMNESLRWMNESLRWMNELPSLPLSFSLLNPQARQEVAVVICFHGCSNPCY
ncbi:hypothetical protein, partial [Nostoc sp.]|uniref:hypothetical protein n=1 Tax=Nostoc sp. TaxID=1180 RepID=UPI002FF79D2D